MLQYNNFFNTISSSLMNNPNQLIFGILFISMAGFITCSIYNTSSSAPAITTNNFTQTESSLVNNSTQTDSISNSQTFVDSILEYRIIDTPVLEPNILYEDISLYVEQIIQTDSSLVNVSTQTDDPNLFYMMDSYHSTIQSGISSYDLEELQVPMDHFINTGGRESDIQGYIQYLENQTERSDIDAYINYLNRIDGWRNDIISTVENVAHHGYENTILSNEARVLQESINAQYLEIWLRLHDTIPTNELIVAVNSILI
jgi:hypothetical protein